MEIERKFLLREKPADLENYPRHELAQGYISVDPVIRIRSVDTSYVLTIKSGGLAMREEYEIPLTEKQFTGLIPKVSGLVIRKTRYRIPEKNGLTIEVDVFHGTFEGLLYAEVEFPSPEDEKKYVPRSFMTEDVTGDGRFQNSALSAMSETEARRFVSDTASRLAGSGKK